MESLILNIIILHLGTIGISLASLLKLGFKLIKDIANEGYKINIDRLTEINNSITPNKKVLLNLLIPFWNIVYAIKNIENYKFSFNSFYSSLSVMDALEEMNDFEKKEYAKKTNWIQCFNGAFNI